MSSVQPIEIKIFGDDRRILEALSRKAAAGGTGTCEQRMFLTASRVVGPSVTIEPEAALCSSLG